METIDLQISIVNLSVLKEGRQNRYTSGSTSVWFYGSTYNSTYTQSILGWTATDAGLLLIPGSITTAFHDAYNGKLIQRCPTRLHDWCWFSSFLLFTYMMHNVMTPDTGVEHMYWVLILRGVGLGLLFVPITTLSLSMKRRTKKA
jgi:DHA2 family multidrug resistance protein